MHTKFNVGDYVTLSNGVDEYIVTMVGITKDGARYQLEKPVRSIDNEVVVLSIEIQEDFIKAAQ